MEIRNSVIKLEEPSQMIKDKSMKTLLDVNLNVLVEFDSWKKANKEWTIGDYLHLKYDMNAAIAFSKFLFPNFIEKEGCIILEFLYSEETFRQWHTYFNGDVQKVEFKCNLYEVKDFFTNQINVYDSHEKYDAAVNELAKILKQAWGLNLLKLFPDRRTIVDVWEEHNTTRISLFTRTT